MSACFYDYRWSAYMVGADKHMFFTRPDPVVGKPDKDSRYAAACPQVWIFSNSKLTSTVTSDGNRMIQKGFANITLALHIPVKIAQYSYLGVATANLLWWMSKTEPKLVARSVTGEGIPLATCVWMAEGVNVNCGGYGSVFNQNTVMTQPSAGDFAAAGIAVGGSALVSKLFSELFPGMSDVPKAILETIFDYIKGKTFEPMLDEVIDDNRDAIDGCL